MEPIVSAPELRKANEKLENEVTSHPSLDLNPSLHRIIQQWPKVVPQAVLFRSVSFTYPSSVSWLPSSPWHFLSHFTQNRATRQQVHQAVASASGYLNPGSLTLVLGAVGSGKSTLMGLLSGRLQTSSGSVAYSGHSINPPIPQRVAGLGGHSDHHLGSLTVRETLNFFISFVDPAPQALSKLHGDGVQCATDAGNEGKAKLVQSCLELLALSDCADVPVASAMVANDQRHRLGLAELLLARTPVVLFDQVSKMFDGSASFKVLVSIRALAQVLQLTVACTLLWPTQEVFNLFDQVIVMAKGHIIYHGAREDALHYFRRLGYSKAQHLSVPEFLQDVASPGGAKYLAPGACSHFTPQQFAEHFTKSNQWRDAARIMRFQGQRNIRWLKGRGSAVLNGITFKMKAMEQLNFDGEAQHRANSECSVTTPATALGTENVPETGTSLEDGSLQPSSEPDQGKKLLRGLQLRGQSRNCGSGGLPQGTVVVESCKSEEEQQDRWELAEGVQRTGVVREGDEVVGLAVGDEAEMRFSESVGGDMSPQWLLWQLHQCQSTGTQIRLQLESRALPTADGVSDGAQLHLTKLLSQEYPQRRLPETSLLLQRQLHIILRNKFLLLARVSQVVFLSAFNAFNCFQMPSSPPSLFNCNLRRAIFLTSLITMTLNNVGQLPFFLSQRGTVRKHVAMKLFRPSSFVIADFAAGLPFSLAEALLLTSLVYPIAGLARGIAHFFIVLAVMTLVALHGAALVRLLAHLAPSTSAFLTLFIAPSFFLFSHFFTPKPMVPPHWVWAYWIDPLQWAANMLMANEFQSSTFSTPCVDSDVPFCRTFQQDSVGTAYLNLYGWNSQRYIWWVGPTVIAVWTALYLALTAACIGGWRRMMIGRAIARAKWRADFGGPRSTTDGDSEWEKANSGECPVVVHPPADENNGQRNLLSSLSSTEEPKGSHEAGSPELRAPTGCPEWETVAELAPLANADGQFQGDGCPKDVEACPEGTALGEPLSAAGAASCRGLVAQPNEKAETPYGSGSTSVIRGGHHHTATESSTTSCAIEECRAAGGAAEPFDRPKHPPSVNAEGSQPGGLESATAGHDTKECSSRSAGDGRYWKGKLSMPFQRLMLTWHHASYEVAPRGGRGQGIAVVKDASGWVGPGEIFAVAGGPKTGKTSLLNVLSGRKLTGRLQGEVLVNGEPRELRKFILHTSYLERGEQYYPFLTVEESMQYRAGLNLPRSTPSAAKSQFIHEILDMCQLREVSKYVVQQLLFPSQASSTPRRQTLPGASRQSNPLMASVIANSVSSLAAAQAGQQRPDEERSTQRAGTADIERRVVVAMELAGNPSVLFLDQPFVGMDLPQMINFAQILRRIASTGGRAVILTTIMPCIYLLDTFDRVALIRRVGETVYLGPSGKMGTAITAYFSSIPGAPSIPSDSSPMSFIEEMIEQPACSCTPDGDLESSGHGVSDPHSMTPDYAAHYQASALALANENFLQQFNLGARNDRKCPGQKHQFRIRRCFKLFGAIVRKINLDENSLEVVHTSRESAANQPEAAGFSRTKEWGCSVSPADSAEQGHRRGRRHRGVEGENQELQGEKGQGVLISAQMNEGFPSSLGDGGHSTQPDSRHLGPAMKQPFLGTSEKQPDFQHLGPAMKQSFWRRLLLVNWKVQTIYWRNRAYTFNRWLYCIVLGVIIGTLFFRLPHDALLGVAARAGFIFAVGLYGSLANVGTAASLQAQLTKITKRERLSKHYFSGLHNLAFSVAEIIYVAINTLTFAGISGLLSQVAVSSVQQFFTFWFSLFLAALSASQFGILLALLLPDFRLASVLIPIIIGVWFATNGYIVPYNQLGSFFRLFFWTNPLHYALSSMGSAVFYCDTSVTTCNTKTDPVCDCPRIADLGGMFVWDYFISSRTYWPEVVGWDWLFLASFFCLCHLGALAALKLLPHHKGR